MVIGLIFAPAGLPRNSAHRTSLAAGKRRKISSTNGHHRSW